jgi:hypothetical protein
VPKIVDLRDFSRDGAALASGASTKGGAMKRPRTTKDASAASGSAMACGDLAGVALPDGFVLRAGFNGDFNPGGHCGTVGEAAFLQLHGVTDLDALCTQFVK